MVKMRLMRAFFGAIAVTALVATSGCVSQLPPQMPDIAARPGQVPTGETAPIDRPIAGRDRPQTDDPAALTPSPPAKSPRRQADSIAPPPIPSHLESEPVEEVVVTPTNITGFWRLTAAHSIDVEIGLFSGIH